MNKKRLELWKRLHLSGVVLALVMALLVMTACGASGEEPNPAGSGNAVNHAVNTEDQARTTYPLTVVDSTGTEIVLEQAPKRVVSIVPSETETLFAVGAGDLVVGVDEWSNYPEETANISKVGDVSTNIEAVAALNPDLVVASVSMNSGALEQLRELDIRVYASDPKTLEETIAHIDQIGVILNKQAQAAAVTEQMRSVMEQVTEAVKDVPAKKVYLEFSVGYSVGKGEFIDELLTLAGGENIAGNQEGWFEIDPEQVLQSNPELILYPDLGEDQSIPEAIVSRPGWDQIDAVKNNKVIAVTNDPLVRVGPRLTEGLLELAQTLHPELVK